jgi:hypothetical protein
LTWNLQQGEEDHESQNRIGHAHSGEAADFDLQPPRGRMHPKTGEKAAVHG